MRYTEEQIEFVRENAPGRSRAEIVELFNRRFGTTINITRLKALMNHHKTSTAHGCFRVRVTPEQVDFIRENIAGRSFTELTRLFNERFGVLFSVTRMRGLAAYYKLRNGICRRCELGDERVDEGLTKVKTGPREWRYKQVVVWEAANGPVPKGCVVFFADGNKLNFDLGNLVLASRQEMAAMMAYKYYSPDAELTKQGLALARLTLLINTRKRERKGGKAK
jgi:hypothetical protein